MIVIVATAGSRQSRFIYFLKLSTYCIGCFNNPINLLDSDVYKCSKWTASEVIQKRIQKESSARGGVVLLKHAVLKLGRSVHEQGGACELWLPAIKEIALGGQSVVPNVINHKCTGLFQNFSPPLYA